MCVFGWGGVSVCASACPCVRCLRLDLLDLRRSPAVRSVVQGGFDLVSQCGAGIALD